MIFQLILTFMGWDGVGTTITTIYNHIMYGAMHLQKITDENMSCCTAAAGHPRPAAGTAGNPMSFPPSIRSLTDSPETPISLN